MSTSVAPIQQGRGGRLTHPGSIWLAVLISIALHALLLSDISFHTHRGDQQAYPGMRLRLELNEPITRHNAAKPSLAAAPTSRALVSEHGPLAQHANKTPIQKHQAHKAETGQQARQGKAADLQARYIEAMLRRIEANKYYPQRARRRGMQGEVHVAFRLYAVDDIRNVVIQGASQIFNTVARQSLKQALPFALPPDGLSLPLNVEFVMAFRLN